MKTKILLILTLAFGMTLVSCRKELVGVQPAAIDDEAPCAEISVIEPEVYSVDANTGSVVASMTRSAAHAENTTNVVNLTFWTYDASGNKAAAFYTTSMKGISVSSILGPNWASGSFTVLILCNLGDLTSSAPSTLAAAQQWKYDVSGFKNFDNFPLYGIHSNVTMNTLKLTVERLVSEYRFNFAKQASNPNEYVVNNFFIRNMAKYIRPFGPNYKAAN